MILGLFQRECRVNIARCDANDSGIGIIDQIEQSDSDLEHESDNNMEEVPHRQLAANASKKSSKSNGGKNSSQENKSNSRKHASEIVLYAFSKLLFKLFNNVNIFWFPGLLFK